ncbi:unnamed protein product [Rotaria sp. Silwood2]|nr:unnamed protein product [Rotaria sp. Silwood2]CAF4073189.1 unnamed protein product [Rotaria sp. Silwood2]
MIKSLSWHWFRLIFPICSICFLYICSFHLFLCATNSLIYSTVCLLHGNESFCSEIDRNKSLRASQTTIQKESSQWSLYGTLSFAIIACFISPIYGSLSDTKNRKLPIILTISNAIITGLVITIGSIFRGTKTSLLLYIFANVINGFGGGSLILLSSCFGYVTDLCTEKEQHIQAIAIIEASLNLGVIISYVLCTFIFQLHAKTWHILVVHVVLLVLALLIGIIFLKSQSIKESSSINLWTKFKRPFLDTRDLIIDLKNNNLFLSFFILLLSLFFYELFRMGSPSIYYLYLHRMSFNDTQYAAYFTCEQIGTCLALVFLALLRRRWKINDLYLCTIGLCLSLIGPILFAFASNNKAMIFGAIPSMMFGIYFPVCLRAVLARLVPERDKGKAFSSVALIQNLDLLLGTVACIQIYRASINIFVGLVFIFCVATRLIALILILVQIFRISHSPQLSVKASIDIIQNPLLDIPLKNDNELIHKMIHILLCLLHIFLVCNFSINGLPVIEKKSNIENSTLNAAQRAMLSEYQMDNLPAALRISQIIPKFEPPKKFNLTQIAKDLKDFGIHSLKDDKHIEGVPLERDGKINPDFHKEIFLGNHELFETDIQNDEQKRDKKLEEIFNEADVDHDQRLSKDELLNYVLKNVNQHIHEAKERNSQLFIHNANIDLFVSLGKVTWHEYFALYVKFHKMNSTSVKESDTFDFIQGPFDNNFQRELVKIRFRWTEADVGGDNELDIDEFLAFRHPEIAGHSYKHIVDDLILQMDRNNDQKLNETEFAFLPSSILEDGGNKEWVEMDKRWLEEQKREFHEMDENKDGVLTKDELLKAYDPMNRVHISNQIKKLYEKVDDSPSDNVLTLNEIQKHADVFTDMRILDTEKALHDEI